MAVTVGGSTCPIVSRTHTSIVCTLPAGQGPQVGIVATLTATTVGTSISATQTSNTVFFAYAPPSVTAVIPSTGPTSGGVPIQLTGANFGTGASFITVTVGGLSCPVINSSSSVIFCTLPAGQGSNQQVLVSVASQLSTTSSVFFSYNGPTLTSINPATASTAGNVPLTLTGSNFGSSGVVTVGGQSCPAVSQSATQIVCTLPSGEGANRAVQVFVGSSTSGSLFFSYRYIL
jgi:hypothetical protein